jgi:hypothetical protein
MNIGTTAVTINRASAALALTGVSIDGNAGTATTLQNARAINGTNFNGSAAITTANWGTARNITIGNTTKSVNGSGNVSWSLAEIGSNPNIDASNITSGTLNTARLPSGRNEVYTGDDPTNVVFPIGTCLIVKTTTLVSRNSTTIIRITGGFVPLEYISHTEIGPIVTGTWRSRGYSTVSGTFQSIYYYLYERAQ